MIAEYKRQLILKEVLQKHLSEYYDNIASLREKEQKILTQYAQIKVAQQTGQKAEYLDALSMLT